MPDNPLRLALAAYGVQQAAAGIVAAARQAQLRCAPAGRKHQDEA